MLQRLLLLAFISIFDIACAFAQANPADVTAACDLALPLNGITAVRFYERTGAAAPFTYTLAKEVPVSSAAATGTLVVSAILQVPDDGIPHAYIARTYNGPVPPAVLPATNVSYGGESPDSGLILITVKKGATAAPGAHRVINVTLR